MNVAERLARGASGSAIVARCLGAFRLEDPSGNSVPIRTRKARALLAALAMQGRAMSRDALADLLWSDRGEAQARSSLRQTIFELQHLRPQDGSFLIAGREEAAVRREVLVTDLELIRTAAATGDWPRLMTLLESSDPGLLTDLDGLDPEMDDWLRLQRAHEPARSFGFAVEAAERCAAQAGPRAALDLVCEILRLDPVSEEARRLAMRLSHEVGDKVALHRHFTALRDRLRDDFDAEPSEETLGLFKTLSNGNGKPKRVAAVTDVELVSPAKPSRWAPAIARLILLVALIAFALTLFLRSPQGPADRVVVAVLPFDQQPSDRSFLAEGLWEQTRGALTRNRSIQVLGRTTTEAMARQHLAPDEYRKRFGITHILEGSVRRSGDELLVSVTLSRTKDGVAVWQDAFRGRMGQPFALQDAIANGIEGKLRARLSPGGGRRADQIATTPQVYALYSEARRLIGTRERANFKRAEALLRDAVRQDPNYAPAWSLLGAAIQFNGRIAIADSKAGAEAEAAVRKALAMAPNFAPAHATLALLQGEGSPEAEPQLRRAVALDPSYSEAWSWLGNSLYAQGRHREAMQAYGRALELDPLLIPAVVNYAMTAAELGDHATTERLARKVAAAGASPELIVSLRASDAYIRRDYSAALKLLAERGRDASGHPKRLLWGDWFESLTGIGYYDALHLITGCPDWYAPLVRGQRLPPTVFEGKPVTPEEFWTSEFFSAPAARAMILHGRSSDLVRLYRAGFRNADDFITRSERRALFPVLASDIAVALQAEGQEDEARYLLDSAATRLEMVLKRTPLADATGQLAMIRAVQGDRAQSVTLLNKGIDREWLPNGRDVALDLAQEPAFEGLQGDPGFEAARKRILDHIAEERAELGPLKV